MAIHRANHGRIAISRGVIDMADGRHESRHERMTC